MLHELRDEDVGLAPPHPVDRRRKRVVVADGDLLSEITVALHRGEAAGPAKLGPCGALADGAELGELRLFQPIEGAIPPRHAEARRREEGLSHDGWDHGVFQCRSHEAITARRCPGMSVGFKVLCFG